jgi:FMN phosphatase YigB (HAD superfamily)
MVTAEDRLAKPDPALYQAALDRLTIMLAEAMFFDDWLESVEGARGVGMHAVHVMPGDHLLDLMSSAAKCQQSRQRESWRTFEPHAAYSGRR